jgi:hypothetical protein
MLVTHLRQAMVMFLLDIMLALEFLPIVASQQLAIMLLMVT